MSWKRLPLKISENSQLSSNFPRKETPAQSISLWIYKIFESNFFTEYLGATASWQFKTMKILKHVVKGNHVHNPEILQPYQWFFLKKSKEYIIFFCQSVKVHVMECFNNLLWLNTIPALLKLKCFLRCQTMI